MHRTATPDRRVGLDTQWAETVDRLRAFVAARVDDREIAADITQDVIVRSIASGALERVDNPVAWLYRSARNAVIDHYRTRHLHDPITQVGGGVALTSDDMIEASLTAEQIFHFTSLGPNVGPTVLRLAAMQPTTLATMHGPSYQGDGAAQRAALASGYARVVADEAA